MKNNYKIKYPISSRISWSSDIKNKIAEIEEKYNIKIT